MNIKKFALKVFKSKKKIIAFCVSMVIIMMGIFCLMLYNHAPKTNTTSLNKLLLEASDLATAKLNITAMTEYSDTGIKILNRSDFTMVYEATVWAGIDMAKVRVVSDDLLKIVHVEIPKATIQDAKVKSSTIKYFDEKFSLFNVDAKEDANRAIALAEKSVKEEAVKTGILELADKQSATLIEGLLSKAIPNNYTLDAKVVN